MSCTTIKFKKLDKNAVMPKYGSAKASGVDLVALESVDLYPDHPTLVHTGIAVAIPDGYEGQIRARSGWANKHHINLANGIGTIDSDYRGEIMVSLVWNDWMELNGKDLFSVKSAIDWKASKRLVYHINAGDRIAQLVICPVERPKYEETEDLDETDRGEGGFGSTGMSTNDTGDNKPSDENKEIYHEVLISHFVSPDDSITSATTSATTSNDTNAITPESAYTINDKAEQRYPAKRNNHHNNNNHKK